MVAKIALEEHCMCPTLTDYWLPTMSDVHPDAVKAIGSKLNDYGELRLAAMDRAGIEIAVLSASGPGVQAERDIATAIRNARAANDFLAEQIRKRPDRYRGFAHLAMQDGKTAADELERCMREFGFAGGMINGHTNGMYLDDPSLTVFWERAEALGALVYLHPADPVSTMPVLQGTKGLKRATWEWGVETGSHALRLVFSGLFDRFPKARLVLGHMGETLPYLLWRFDSRAQLYGLKFDRPPSQTIRENIWVTISGMYSPEPLNCAIAALGAGRIMFAADYPFEDIAVAGRFMDEVALSEPTRHAIANANVKQLCL